MGNRSCVRSCVTRGAKQLSRSFLATDVLVKGKIKKTPPVLSLNDVFSEAADSAVVRLTEPCFCIFLFMVLPLVQKDTYIQNAPPKANMELSFFVSPSCQHEMGSQELKKILEGLLALNTSETWLKLLSTCIASSCQLFGIFVYIDLLDARATSSCDCMPYAIQGSAVFRRSFFLRLVQWWWCAGPLFVFVATQPCWHWGCNGADNFQHLKHSRHSRRLEVLWLRPLSALDFLASGGATFLFFSWMKFAPTKSATAADVFVCKFQ